MALSDELHRLSELHQRGALSDDEFAKAKNRLIETAHEPASAFQNPRSASFVEALNLMRRPLADRWIGGVCSGLAHATGMAPWLWRLGFALLLMFGGSGLVFYILMWVFVPSE